MTVTVGKPVPGIKNAPIDLLHCRCLRGHNLQKFFRLVFIKNLFCEAKLLLANVMLHVGIKTKIAEN